MLRNLRSSLLAPILLVSMSFPAFAQTGRARIVNPIDESRLTRLSKNTHPLARSEFDRGAAPDALPLSRMLLVLTRGVDSQENLDLLLRAQQDKNSSEYHKWLTPRQFGQRFGAADADINKITAWLSSHGFQVSGISNGRNVIEFSGDAGQVRQAFHTEIHKYVVDGKTHWANASDPEIPTALATVVAGVSTLHNFRKAPQIAKLKTQVATAGAVGVHPQFTGSDGTYALAPGDFATIYNVNPVYAAGVTGAGTTIAVVARTNISVSDITDFRNSFALSNNPPQIVLNGTDPGDLGDGDEAEAVLDTSWSGALAPSATVKLVVSASTNTTDGVDLSEQYIVDNNLADVMTESYGDCEADYTEAEAQFYSSLAEQAASEGITFTVASGDSGAEGCDDPSSETIATGPVSVNILAATPYNIAVGGTQFNVNGNPAAYWGSTNNASNASALSYIPEDVWNESCTAAACGSANAGIWAGAGGASIFFTKPSWQTGASGIPNDGARDVPDISFISASQDSYLICLDGSCTERRGRSFFSGVSGTSAATPSFAGIMALLVQSTGRRQGQANPKLYALAAAEALSSCNASYLGALPTTTCIFNDVTIGNNAVPGQTGYGTGAAVYQAGVGYDLATGLGSINVYNLLSAWNSTPLTTPEINIGIDSPSALNSSVLGLTTFSGWALATSGRVASVAISIDSVPYGNASYGIRRTDVCALYSSSNCPNVGWSVLFDTTTISTGVHVLAATVTTSTGQVYASSSNFTVANWTSANPMKASIDTPNTNSPPFSGTANFGGWAVDSLSAIEQISVAIDGAPYGVAQYGGDRPDVCSVHPGEAACPYVGWNFVLNTTTIADGIHTLAITPVTTGGQASTFSASFTVANNSANVITMSIDQPNGQSGEFSGYAGFGGWAITTAVPISKVAVTIDGISYGSAVYGGSRSDVCSTHPNRPGCPDVGWNFGLDTTQLINGMHVLGITAYAGTGQFTTATRTFSVSNTPSASPVVIGIDSPNAQNAIVLGQTTFSGWAVDVNSTVNSVTIAIDGVAAGTAIYGSSRPDVCATYPDEPSCPSVGWSFSVDTTRLANGTHTMTVKAIGTHQNTLSSQFTVANWTTGNPMKLSIDTPNSQSGPLSGQLGLGGWAIDQLAGISNVAVAIDNLPLGNAHYGGARADVCKIFPDAVGCPNVGWNYYLDTTELSDGAHTLAVTGTTTGGQSSTFTQSFQVANSASSPLRVSIDTPGGSQTLTGLAPIGGWAVDTSGPQIVSVTILVDGRVNGTAVYGGARGDVCAHYSTAGGCPDVGWNYQLDTAPYANGSHTLEARALSADGKLYTQSVTFFVANQP